ncbi:Origin recognition complex, subunit 1 [Friedmanniomyces endolithicus]|uniref:Origin recognition complex subunit 1 n=1 Tax=Friedmanniomyces endolithicus TaxID=329885 RepID=A0AAN6HF40_9PEZI|nr:Origin recognition complex, subunit 1 [Friedmanniomyces endolithicus]KAK0780528.1 Origin recognition complex, subunit 1 [Friedmanniomyces endolithicus]KAK0788498.1 Origin recognition complex, subunit 1 [Friedmanniomyces endolithicus]KAK0796356.1 Origin recognition complex, subunit 1 [Friedmanniomyces endolithicus]KAK0850395.1 Origin recognition complex, subunit 1 [Friedmanniomyces endolithicus]
MPGKRKRTKLEEARHYLSGGGVLREDSDDELGREDHPWEWVYGEKEGSSDGTKNIVGARMGRFECRIGDIVLLKAPASNEAWVAIIWNFSDAETEDEDGDVVSEKQAGMLWFSSDKEIRSKKRRTDCLPNELYITPTFDNNALTTINGKAIILSREASDRRYPGGRIPRNSADHGKVFICRRGVNSRTATYTDEFEWEDVYRGKDDMESLLDLVETNTTKTRKRKALKSIKEHDLDDFVVGEGEGDPQTTRKRRKLASGTPTPSKAKQLTPRKLATPTGRKIVTKKPLEFTPLGTRLLSPSQPQSSPYQIARSTLHVSAVPRALPCRESEFETVYSHLEAAITAGTGACIYISGTPGTGKTATVREVVASLQSAVAEEQLDDFCFVEINGMKVTDPHQSYSLLWEALKGDRVSSAHALELLEREFTTPSPRRVPCVVLMDELDQLVTRNQGVMYNFFNWPQLRHSRLIVLAVANTMDLPERTLSNKISSRLGLTRITFPGYTHTQLMAIIQSRLEGVGTVIVDPDAVQFASRKVAAVSGDARRALDICRRAVELAEQETLLPAPTQGQENQAPDTPSKTPGRQKPPPLAVGSTAQQQKKGGIVTIATIKRAINEATSTPLAASLRALPLASKVFLAALLARLRRTGIAEATLADVVDEARRMAVSGTGTGNKLVERWLLLLPSPAAAVAGAGLPVSEGGAGGEGLGTPSRRGRQAGGAGKKELERPGARVVGLGLAARELAEAGIVGLENRHGDRVGRVRLGVSEDDVRGALREDGECIGLGVGG